MSNVLATYLHDHLAGSNFAVDLLKTLREEHAGTPLGAFAATLLVDVEKDRDVLQGIIDRLGEAPPILKEAAAWVSGKVSQLKLGRSVGGALGTFEALEALALGILGKLALWRALRVIAEIDDRVGGIDFDELAKRALAQNAKVEDLRLDVARAAFGAGTE